MYDPLDHSKIRSWIDDWGGGPDHVDYLKGNADLATLLAFSRILFPRFVEVDGCVLWDRAYEESNFALWRHSLAGDTRKIESTLNQLRAGQLVESDDTNEDQRALEFVFECIASAWRDALRTEFADRVFTVRVFRSEDGPVVTFFSDPE